MSAPVFSFFKSNTLLGTIAAVLGYLLSPEVLAVLPQKVAAIVTAIGVIWGVFGARTAIAKNGTGA